MILNPYENSLNLDWAYKLWDIKEENDLTVIGLANQLNEDPLDVEKWLSAELEIKPDSRQKIEEFNKNGRKYTFNTSWSSN